MTPLESSFERIFIVFKGLSGFLLAVELFPIETEVGFCRLALEGSNRHSMKSESVRIA
jgi:hypothetical protein